MGPPPSQLASLLAAAAVAGPLTVPAPIEDLGSVSLFTLPGPSALVCLSSGALGLQGCCVELEDVGDGALDVGTPPGV